VFRKLKDSSKAYRKIHIYLNVEIPDIPAVGGQAEHPIHLLALNITHHNVIKVGQKGLMISLFLYCRGLPVPTIFLQLVIL